MQATPCLCHQTTPCQLAINMRAVSRRLLENALADHHVTSSQKLKYSCDTAKLPRDVASKFIQLGQDDETTEFIERSKSRAGNLCLQLLYTLLQVILGMFLSQTSINGLLYRGQMFVFSKSHLQSLFSSSLSRPTLLDIGAGDGAVTTILEQTLSPSAIHVTETSPVMQRRLRNYGYQVLDVKSWPLTNPSYDVIACLNVLDRCERPLSLLHLLYQHLAPGGLLLLALVLPYDPFVEKGPHHASPSEFLPVDGVSWEDEVTSLLQNQLLPMGLELHAVTRLPYLCEGDSSQDYYSLDDVVVVLKKPLEL